MAFRLDTSTFVDLIAFERLLEPLAVNLEEPTAGKPSDDLVDEGAAGWR